MMDALWLDAAGLKLLDSLGEAHGFSAPCVMKSLIACST